MRVLKPITFISKLRLRSLFLTGFATSVGLGLQFYNLGLFARIFDQEQYGFLMLTFSIVSVGAVFSRFGSQPAILKFGAKGADYNSIRYFGTIRLSSYACLFGSVIVGLVSVFLLYNGFSVNRIWLFLLILLLTFSVSINGISSAIYRIEGFLVTSVLSTKFVEQSVYFLGASLLAFFLVDIKILDFLLIVSGVIFLSAIVLNYIVVSKIDKKEEYSFFENKKLVMDIVKFSFFSYLINLSQIVLKNTDVFLVSMLGTLSNVGVYGLAQKYSEFFCAAAPMVNIVYAKTISTLVSNRDYVGLHSEVKKAMLLNVFFVVMMSVVFWILQDSIVGWLGDGYHKSIELIGVLWLGKFLSAVMAPVSITLIFLNRGRVLAMQMVCVAIFNAVFVVSGFYLALLDGVAVAVCLSLVLLSGLNYHLYRRTVVAPREG